MALVLLIVLILVALAIVLTVVVQFNKLRRLDQLCIGSFADIDTLLTKRADLVPNLVQTVTGARDFEASTLESVTKARAASVQAAGIEQKAEADAGLTAALGRLFAVAEAYPQLTATANFRDLQAQLAEVESQLQFSRQFYNDTVVTLNTALRTIPSMWFAGMAGVSTRPVYQEADQARRQAPTVDFSG
ncbi:MAG: LemA family protein [Actinomycetales bacterium]|nr:LemA family protein [Actinomycetales bacterium]